VLVVSAEQDPSLVSGYLNAYRILISDLVVLTMAEDGDGHDRVRREVEEVKPGIPVVSAVLRPRPRSSIAGQDVAFFTTAPPPVHVRLASQLRDIHGARSVAVFGSLADRARLRADLDGTDADAYLVELKAAAIDVVAEAAAARGIEVVLVENEVAGAALDGELRALAGQVLDTIVRR
jgi:cyclic 2,3-diphosphoglycerate synthetase